MRDLNEYSDYLSNSISFFLHLCLIQYLLKPVFKFPPRENPKHLKQIERNFLPSHLVYETKCLQDAIRFPPGLSDIYSYTRFITSPRRGGETFGETDTYAMKCSARSSLKATIEDLNDVKFLFILLKKKNVN